MQGFEMSSVEDRIRIVLPTETVEQFCRRWQIVEMALFGSVLRDDFGPDSDIDMLVTFAPDFQRTLADAVAMQDEIEALLGRKVDLINRRTIEQSRNYIRRKAILSSARTIYVARPGVPA